MNEIKLIGKIQFEPENVTNKQMAQSSWKKVAFVLIGGDECEYYAWFIKKRYDLILNVPVRKSHISFINDSHRDLGEFGLSQWESVKKKWDNKSIEVILSTDVRSNSLHWWLVMPHEHRGELLNIRAELGLGKPFFGIHMSIGYANPKYEEHSKYIHRLIENGLIIT